MNHTLNYYVVFILLHSTKPLRWRPILQGTQRWGLLSAQAQCVTCHGSMGVYPV